MFVYVLTSMARTADARCLWPLVFDGRIQEAAEQAEGRLETRGGEAAVELATFAGDLMLAQDRDEEAEELYRQAVKAAAAAPRGQVRVLACRNTGFLSLYQQRFGTAASCFRRLGEDAAATAAQKVEALGGLALAHHGMGQIQQAMQALDDATECATEGVAAGGAAELVMFTSLLRVELLVQREIRSHAALHDHVFWQTPASNAQARVQMEPLAAIAVCLDAHGHHDLAARRLQHLRALVLASCGDAAAMQSLHDRLAWLRRAGIFAGERQCRLETALVAIVARNAEMARCVLEPLCGRAGDGPGQRWNFELSYCLAKVCELAGNSGEAMKHYQRYALESLQCLRTEASVQHSRSGEAAPAAGPVKDEVEMSLPAKYRRAYRYLIAHLDCATLSIREIAEHIGVTERALQSAFRSYLGMTPVEVMRRCRVERIRDDLLKGDNNGLTVIEAATRWGISNRSTLLSSYRKHFRETPADTLARCGEAALAGRQ